MQYTVVTRHAAEREVVGTLQVPCATPGRLCLSDVRRAWPWGGGQWCFRAQVLLKGGSDRFMWLDLKSPEGALPRGLHGQYVVKALPMFELREGGEVEPRFTGVAWDLPRLLAAHRAARPDIARPDAPYGSLLEQHPLDVSLPRAATPSTPPPGTQSASAQHSAAAMFTAGSKAASSAWGHVTGAASAAATFMSKHAGKVDAEKVRSGALSAATSLGGFLKRTAAAAGAMLDAGSTPPEEALVNLSELHTLMYTPFNATLPAHEALLQRLWSAVAPDAEYAPVSPAWQELGFQGDDPRTDFRGGGLLSLHCLVHAAEGGVLGSILASQVRLRQASAAGERAAAGDDFDGFVSVGLEDVLAGREGGAVEQRLYPVALAGVNLVVSLAALVGVGEETVQHKPSKAWGLFSHYEGFFELFSLALLYFDGQWRAGQVAQEGFQPLLKAVVRHVAGWLEAGPQSPAGLRDIVASADGITL